MKIARIRNKGELELKNEIIEYTPVSIDISTGKTSGMTSSSMYNSSYGPQNLVDGNITFGANRAFASANNAPLPQWFQIDLGGIYYVDTVRWINNRTSARLPGDYRIEVSTTGVFNGEEILVASKDGNTTYTWVEHTFTTIECRYVRMTVTRIHAGAYFELAEWKIWGYNSKNRNKVSFKEENILVDEIIEYPRELEGGRNLLPTKYESFVVNDGTYGWIKLAEEGTPLTVKVYDTGADVDMGSAYFGLTKIGKNFTGGGSFWLMANGNLSRTERQTEEAMYFSFYPKNRVTFDRIFEKYKIKVEIGNKATTWTPAPEDLGLWYSDDIQYFNMGIKDNILMITELIEGVDL